jgi:hypothetical protein
MKLETLNSTQLKQKKNNLLLTSYSVGTIAGVGAAIYAISKKKKFWTIIGWWIVGSIAVGVPSRLFIHKRINKIDALMEEKLKMERFQAEASSKNTK